MNWPKAKEGATLEDLTEIVRWLSREEDLVSVKGNEKADDESYDKDFLGPLLAGIRELRYF